jgi:hypothetical protein
VVVFSSKATTYWPELLGAAGNLVMEGKYFLRLLSCKP